MKRLLTIQDISCIGKCSLTVALPVISACGVECAVLPTAVLSTHTAFRGFTFRDLTDEITPVTNHWKEQNLTFDAIYTGYLGSFEQLGLTEKIFSDAAPGTLIFVDPVMGDNGALYPGFNQEFADKMALLCSKADVIVPNLTEACFMLHREYIAEGYDRGYIENILRDLTATGCRTAVLTGVSFEKGRTGVMAYTASTDTFTEYYNEKINASFHGTGDIFASVCSGAMTRGLPLGKALKTAADFTAIAIEVTIKNKNHNWYGVDFEEVLCELPSMMKNA